MSLRKRLTQLEAHFAPGRCPRCSPPRLVIYCQNGLDGQPELIQGNDQPEHCPRCGRLIKKKRSLK
jgi:hypothetical protein